MSKQEAMKPGKVPILAFWLLNHSPAFSGFWFPAQTLISASWLRNHSPGFLRVSWFPAQASISVVKGFVVQGFQPPLAFPIATWVLN
jgi:hypothetical protein